MLPSISGNTCHFYQIGGCSHWEMISLCMDSMAKFLKSPTNATVLLPRSFVGALAVLWETRIQSSDCALFSLSYGIYSAVFNMRLSCIFLAMDLIFLKF